MRNASFVLFVAALAGCQFSQNRYLGRAVSPDELMGSWRATDFAITSLSAVGVRNHLSVEEHTLVLSADGSCRIRTIMNMPVLEPPDYRTYDTGCRWRLGDVGHQALQLDLKPAPPAGSPYYYFAEEAGQLLLWQYAADPDAWRYMEFEKIVAPETRLHPARHLPGSGTLRFPRAFHSHGQPIWSRAKSSDSSTLRRPTTSAGTDHRSRQRARKKIADSN